MNKEMIKPQPGMGATMRLGSDCYPYTIGWVNEKKTRIIIQPDMYDLIEGSIESEDQGYRYHRNEFAEGTKVSLRKDGSWRVTNSQTPVSIGRRRAYRDPSF